MDRVVSVGIMEQPSFRSGSGGADLDGEMKAILGEVTHVEQKHLAPAGPCRERVLSLSRHAFSLLHAQYPPGGGSLNLVDPQFRRVIDRDEYRRILESLRPEIVSLHLGFSAERLRSGGQFDCDVAESPTLAKDMIRRRIVDNVAWVKEELGVAPILENLDYNRTGAYEHVTDPTFITEVLEQADAGMLLDIGHAEVSSANLGVDCRSYLHGMPLERVVEIHLSRPGPREKDTERGPVVDSHRSISEGDRSELLLLQELLQAGRLPRLRAVTLETFDDVVPQIALIKDTLRRGGKLLLGDVLAPGFLFDLDGSSHAELFDGARFVWEVLGRIGEYASARVGEAFRTSGGRGVGGEVSGRAVIGGDVRIEPGARVGPYSTVKGRVYLSRGVTVGPGSHLSGEVFIGEGTTILPNAVVSGPAVIGRHCELRPGTFIRGNVVLGDHVEWRSEAKNAVILSGIVGPDGAIHTAAAHFSYVGDSVIGRGANLGAGTKISNLKADWTPVTVNVDGWRFHPGIFKIGAFVGDGASTGCNTVLNPGTVLGPGSITYPNSSVGGFVGPGTIVKLRQTQDSASWDPGRAAPSMSARRKTVEGMVRRRTGPMA